MKNVSVLVPLLAVAQTAHAQEGGGYVGFSLGAFDYEEVDDDLGLTIADTTTTYRFIGGYRVSEKFAAEGGWAVTGDFKETATELVPGVGPATVDLKADFQILTLRALWLLPLERMSLIGGVGYYHATIDGSASLRGFGELVDLDDSGGGVTVVGGIQFDLERVSVRGEFEWLDADSDVEAWNVTVGVLFRL